MPFRICDFSTYKKELLIKNYEFSERFTRAKLEREKVVIENESENAMMFFLKYPVGRNTGEAVFIIDRRIFYLYINYFNDKELIIHDIYTSPNNKDYINNIISYVTSAFEELNNTIKINRRIIFSDQLNIIINQDYINGIHLIASQNVEEFEDG